MAPSARRTTQKRGGAGQTAVPIERTEVGNHVIEVRSPSDPGEQLWIDGERRQFFVTSAGYHLLDDAYRPAEKTLIDAARKHLERLTQQAPEERK
jgi:hypothetical protein